MMFQTLLVSLKKKKKTIMKPLKFNQLQGKNFWPSLVDLQFLSIMNTNCKIWSLWLIQYHYSVVLVYSAASLKSYDGGVGHIVQCLSSNLEKCYILVRDAIPRTIKYPPSRGPPGNFNKNATSEGIRDIKQHVQWGCKSVGSLASE